MNSKIKTGALIGAFSFMALGSATLGGNVFADTTYTSAQFPDANFFDCVKTRAGVDTTATSITQAQAESVTQLSCTALSSTLIQSTEGIQYLPNITDLNINGHPNLTSIDLSHNNKLKQIFVFDNSSLTSLTLGQQPALTTLYAYNNALQGIDITNAPALYEANLFKNKISSIDTSHNPALTSLVLSNNELTDIDLSANTNLSQAFLYGNKIQYLDVSKINNSLLNLNLDDDVLVRTNFVAVQLAQGGNYYADADTSGDMFISMQVATGLSDGTTKITTPGAAYYYDKDDTPKHCAPGHPFCIIFDANILDYQNYVQLAYVGEPASQTVIDQGRDNTKRNYRLEINLEAYREDRPGGNTNIRVPNTGIFSGENNAIAIVVSVVSTIFIAAILFAIAYGIKRHNSKVKFSSSRF